MKRINIGGVNSLLWFTAIYQCWVTGFTSFTSLPDGRSYTSGTFSGMRDPSSIFTYQALTGHEQSWYLDSP